MEFLLITAVVAAFVGFVFGWLFGNMRNNQVLADMETALLKMEKKNRELKDYEAFYRHHLTAAFGSTSPLLTENDIKRQIMESKV